MQSGKMGLPPPGAPPLGHRGSRCTQFGLESAVPGDCRVPFSMAEARRHEPERRRKTVARQAVASLFMGAVSPIPIAGTEERAGSHLGRSTHAPSVVWSGHHHAVGIDLPFADVAPVYQRQDQPASNWRIALVPESTKAGSASELAERSPQKFEETKQADERALQRFQLRA